eukprot:gene1552-937_t
MDLLQTIHTSAEPETYVINGCVASGGTAVALSLSSNTIRLYDAQSTAFVLELRDHNDSITDLVSSPANPHLLFSSQEDGGVMVTDLRQGRPAQFITDACGSGITCSSISISPSGNALLVGKSGDLDVYDTRSWTPARRIEQMHWDDITRVRHITEDVVCSTGEDLMINHIDTACSTPEDDILLQATNCGEVITRMTAFNEVGLVGMVGSCENAYLYPYQVEEKEVKINRPDFSTYLVDWAMVGGELVLVSGVRDGDGNAGPLSVVSWADTSLTSAAVGAPSRVWTPPQVHRQLCRVALGIADRLITGGEDGLLAFWRCGDAALHGGQLSLSSSANGAQKEREKVSLFRESKAGSGAPGAPEPRHLHTAAAAHRNRGRPYQNVRCMEWTPMLWQKEDLWAQLIGFPPFLTLFFSSTLNVVAGFSLCQSVQVCYTHLVRDEPKTLCTCTERYQMTDLLSFCFRFSLDSLFSFYGFRWRVPCGAVRDPLPELHGPPLTDQASQRVACAAALPQATPQPFRGLSTILVFHFVAMTLLFWLVVDTICVEEPEGTVFKGEPHGLAHDLKRALGDLEEAMSAVAKMVQPVPSSFSSHETHPRSLEVRGSTPLLRHLLVQLSERMNVSHESAAGNWNDEKRGGLPPQRGTLRGFPFPMLFAPRPPRIRVLVENKGAAKAAKAAMDILRQRLDDTLMATYFPCPHNRVTAQLLQREDGDRLPALFSYSVEMSRHPRPTPDSLKAGAEELKLDAALRSRGARNGEEGGGPAGFPHRNGWTVLLVSGQTSAPRCYSVGVESKRLGENREIDTSGAAGGTTVVCTVGVPPEVNGPAVVSPPSLPNQEGDPIATALASALAHWIGVSVEGRERGPAPSGAYTAALQDALHHTALRASSRLIDSMIRIRGDLEALEQEDREGHSSHRVFGMKRWDSRSGWAAAETRWRRTDDRLASEAVMVVAVLRRMMTECSPPFAEAHADWWLLWVDRRVAAPSRGYLRQSTSGAAGEQTMTAVTGRHTAANVLFSMDEEAAALLQLRALLFLPAGLGFLLACSNYCRFRRKVHRGIGKISLPYSTHNSVKASLPASFTSSQLHTYSFLPPPPPALKRQQQQQSLTNKHLFVSFSESGLVNTAVSFKIIHCLLNLQISVSCFVVFGFGGELINYSVTLGRILSLIGFREHFCLAPHSFEALFPEEKRAPDSCGLMQEARFVVTIPHSAEVALGFVVKNMKEPMPIQLSPQQREVILSSLKKRKLKVDEQDTELQLAAAEQDSVFVTGITAPVVSDYLTCVPFLDEGFFHMILYVVRCRASTPFVRRTLTHEQLKCVLQGALDSARPPRSGYAVFCSESEFNKLTKHLRCNNSSVTLEYLNMTFSVQQTLCRVLQQMCAESTWESFLTTNQRYITSNLLDAWETWEIKDERYNFLYLLEIALVAKSDVAARNIKERYFFTGNWAPESISQFTTVIWRTWGAVPQARRVLSEEDYWDDGLRQVNVLLSRFGFNRTILSTKDLKDWDRWLTIAAQDQKVTKYMKTRIMESLFSTIVWLELFLSKVAVSDWKEREFWKKILSGCDQMCWSEHKEALIKYASDHFSPQWMSDFDRFPVLFVILSAGAWLWWDRALEKTTEFVQWIRMTDYPAREASERQERFLGRLTYRFFRVALRVEPSISTAEDEIELASYMVAHNIREPEYTAQEIFRHLSRLKDIHYSCTVLATMYCDKPLIQRLSGQSVNSFVKHDVEHFSASEISFRCCCELNKNVSDPLEGEKLELKRWGTALGFFSDLQDPCLLTRVRGQLPLQGTQEMFERASHFCDAYLDKAYSLWLEGMLHPPESQLNPLDLLDMAHLETETETMLHHFVRQWAMKERTLEEKTSTPLLLRCSVNDVFHYGVSSYETRLLKLGLLGIPVPPLNEWKALQEELENFEREGMRCLIRLSRYAPALGEVLRNSNFLSDAGVLAKAAEEGSSIAEWGRKESIESLKNMECWTTRLMQCHPALQCIIGSDTHSSMLMRQYFWMEINRTVDSCKPSTLDELENWIEVRLQGSVEACRKVVDEIVKGEIQTRHLRWLGEKSVSIKEELKSINEYVCKDALDSNELHSLATVLTRFPVYVGIVEDVWYLTASLEKEKEKQLLDCLKPLSRSKDVPQLRNIAESILPTSISLETAENRLREKIDNMKLHLLKELGDKIHLLFSSSDTKLSPTLREVWRFCRVLRFIPTWKPLWIDLEDHFEDFLSPESEDDTAPVLTEKFYEHMDTLHKEVGSRETVQVELLEWKSKAPFVGALVRCKSSPSLSAVVTHLRRASAFFMHIAETTGEEAEEMRRDEQLMKLLNRLQELTLTVNQQVLQHSNALDEVINDLLAMNRGYSYVIDLATGRAEVHYDRGENRYPTVKGPVEVENFERLLVFALADERHILDDASTSVAEEVLFNREQVDLVRRLHREGVPEFVYPQLVIRRCGYASKLSRLQGADALQDLPVLTPEEMHTLEEREKKWMTELNTYTISSSIFYLLGLSTSQKLSAQLDSGHFWTAAITLHRVLKHSPPVEQLCRQLEETWKEQEERANWAQRLACGLQGEDEIVVPPEMLQNRCACYSCRSEKSVYASIKSIYGNRQPLFFELIWCTRTTSSLELEEMLTRAAKFRQFRFCFVRFDRLSRFNQQLVVSRAAQDKLFHLNFIQLEESLLQLSVDYESHKDLDVLPEVPARTKVHCFVGRSGCGKSFQLRQKLCNCTASRSKEDKCVSCHIVITEKFSIEEAIEKLEEAVKQLHVRGQELEVEAPPRLAVAIRFSVGEYAEDDEAEWHELFRRSCDFLFSLLFMRCVVNTINGSVICLPYHTEMEVLLELPPSDFYSTAGGSEHTLFEHFPVLWSSSSCIEQVQCDTTPFQMDVEDVHVVGKWLYAYKKKRIDWCFPTGSRDAVILLDHSQSMESSDELNEDVQKDTVKYDNNGRLYPYPSRFSIMKMHFPELLDEFDASDRVGVMKYSVDTAMVVEGDQTSGLTLVHCDDAAKAAIKASLDQTPLPQGTNSNLFSAFVRGIQTLLSAPHQEGRKKMLIVVSDEDEESRDKDTCKKLVLEHPEIQIIYIAVAQTSEMQITVKDACQLDMPGNHIFAAQTAEEFKFAMEEVRRHIKVKDFVAELGKGLTLQELQKIVEEFMNEGDRESKWSHTMRSHWMRYMRRQCKVLEYSPKLNNNTTLKNFGTLTMKRMLKGAEHMILKDHVQWKNRCYEILLPHRSYCHDETTDTAEECYEWSVLVVNPSKDPTFSWKLKADELEKELEITLATEEDLRKDEVLEAYLAYAVGAELSNPQQKKKMKSTSGKCFDFPEGFSLHALHEVDETFILTQDFLLKMILMNECLECGKPCIIEGETGVSKTKLSQMLFVAKNWRLAPTGGSERKKNLLDTLADAGDELGKWIAVRKRLGLSESYSNIDAIKKATRDSLNYGVVSDSLRNDIWLCFKDDPFLGRPEMLVDRKFTALDRPDDLWALLDWMTTMTEEHRRESKRSMFEPINVHAALSPHEIAKTMHRCVARAKRLRILAEIPMFKEFESAKVCVFLDEFNTASCMGLMKEIIQDHSFYGEALPENLSIIAACNPHRKRLKPAFMPQQTVEQDDEWAAVHYNVRQLPPALQEMTWTYGALTDEQEKEFIQKRLRTEIREEDLTEEDRHFKVDAHSVASMIHTAQRSVRRIAVKAVTEKSGLLRDAATQSSLLHDQQEKEWLKRGSAAVSIRDMLRCISLLHYFTTMKPELRPLYFPSVSMKKRRPSLLVRVCISISLVYYARLNKVGREEFNGEMVREHHYSIATELEKSVKGLGSHLKLDRGIVNTRGLMENVFAVLTHLEAKVPLIIKGPPGSSKTLAVTVLERHSHFKDGLFAHVKQYISEHYQCSKHTTGNEIENGIKKHFFFMDEAGIPEEEKESLKVLHYHLEHNTESKIGFVALTNQVLDAAKSNRCTVVTRMQYDECQLTELALGYYGDIKYDHRRKQALTQIRDHNNNHLPLEGVVRKLCARFEFLMGEATNSKSASLVHGAEFLGPRSFMHMWKLLPHLAKGMDTEELLTNAMLISSVRQNFGGPMRQEVATLVGALTKDFPDFSLLSKSPFNRFEVLRESFLSRTMDGPPQSRYHLIVSPSTDEAVMHDILKRFQLEQIEGPKKCSPNGFIHIRLNPIYEEVESEKTRTMARLRCSAEKGMVVALTNAQALHEGLYAPLNQNFQVIENYLTKNEPNKFLTQIAEGPNTMECKFLPSTWFIIFVSEQEFQAAPAPFLDRLEKHRISMRDMLHYSLTRSGAINPVPLLNSRLQRVIWHLLHEKFPRFIKDVGADAFYGLKPQQGLESAVLHLIERWQNNTMLCRSVLETIPVVNELSENIPKALLADDHQLEGWLSGTDCAVTDVLAITAEWEVMQLLLASAIPERVLPRLPENLRELYLRNTGFLHFEPVKELSEDRLELILTRRWDADTEDYLEQLGFAIHDPLAFTSEKAQIKNLTELWQRGNGRIAVRLHMRTDCRLINYMRHTIEQLQAHTLTPQKDNSEKRSSTRIHHVILIGIVSAVDTMSYHMYDTCFNCSWKRRFFDSIEKCSIVPWLRLGYGQHKNGMYEECQELLMDCLHSCKALLTGTLRCVALDEHGLYDAYLSTYHMDHILKIRAEDGTSVESLVLSNVFDATQNGMRELASIILNDIVQVQRTQPDFLSLTRVIRSMLVDRLVYMMKYTFQCLAPACFTLHREGHKSNVEVLVNAEKTGSFKLGWRIAKAFNCSLLRKTKNDELVTENAKPADVCLRLRNHPENCVLPVSGLSLFWSIHETLKGLVMDLAHYPTNVNAVADSILAGLDQQNPLNMAARVVGHLQKEDPEFRPAIQNLLSEVSATEDTEMCFKWVDENVSGTRTVIHYYMCYYLKLAGLKAELQRCGLTGQEALSSEALTAALQRRLQHLLARRDSAQIDQLWKWSGDVLLLTRYYPPREKPSGDAAQQRYVELRDVAAVVELHASDRQRSRSKNIEKNFFDYLVSDPDRRNPEELVKLFRKSGLQDETHEIQKYLSRLHIWEARAYRSDLLNASCAAELMPGILSDVWETQRMEYFQSDITFFAELAQSRLKDLLPKRDAAPYLPYWILNDHKDSYISYQIFCASCRWINLWRRSVEDGFDALKNFSPHSNSAVGEVVMAAYRCWTIYQLAKTFKGKNGAPLSEDFDATLFGPNSSFYAERLCVELEWNKEVLEEIQETKGSLGVFFHQALNISQNKAKPVPHLTLWPLSMNLFSFAKSCGSTSPFTNLRTAIEAAEFLSRLWVLPEMWKVYIIVRGYTERFHLKTSAISLALIEDSCRSDGYRVELLLAALAEMKTTCNLDLPQIDKNHLENLLVSEDTEGLLDKMFHEIHRKYKKVVLDFILPENIPSLPDATSLQSLSNALGGNEELLERISSSNNCGRGVAETIIRTWSASIQVASPTATLLAPFLWSTSISKEEYESIAFQLKERVCRSLVKGVQHLWRTKPVMGRLKVRADRLHDSSITAESLLYLIHSLDKLGLSRMHELLRRVQNAVVSEPANTTIGLIVERWCETGAQAERWVSDYLGLPKEASQSVLLLQCSRIDDILNAIEHQEQIGAYRFCDKPYEVKIKSFNEEEEKEVYRILDGAAEHLEPFVAFLLQNEDRIVGNALDKDTKNHDLFLLLQGALATKNMLQKKFPFIQQLKSIKAGSGKIQWTTFHYIALRQQILRVTLKSTGESANNSSAEWTWTSGDDVPRTDSHVSFDFLLEEEAISLPPPTSVDGGQQTEKRDRETKKRLEKKYTRSEILKIHQELVRCLEQPDSVSNFNLLRTLLTQLEDNNVSNLATEEAHKRLDSEEAVKSLKMFAETLNSNITVFVDSNAIQQKIKQVELKNEDGTGIVHSLAPLFLHHWSHQKQCFSAWLIHRGCSRSEGCSIYIYIIVSAKKLIISPSGRCAPSLLRPPPPHRPLCRTFGGGRGNKGAQIRSKRSALVGEGRPELILSVLFYPYIPLFFPFLSHLLREQCNPMRAGFGDPREKGSPNGTDVSSPQRPGNGGMAKARSPVLAARMLSRSSLSHQESFNNSSQGSVLLDEQPLGYHSIRIDGDERDTDFSKSVEVISSIIASRQMYKAVDKGQKEDAFGVDMMRTISLLSPPVKEEPTPPLHRASSIASNKRLSAEARAEAGEVSLAASPGIPGSVLPRFGSGSAAVAATFTPPTSISVDPRAGQTETSFVAYHSGIFTYPEMKTQVISWEQYIKDLRAVYGAIENGPCLSVARMRLTAVAQKFQLYSLLNSENENNYDEYIKGGVYANCTKVDNAVQMASSVPAPTLLDFIVTTARENPRVPLFVDPTSGRVVTLSQFLEEGGVKDPEEMTIGGLGLHPSQLTKKSAPCNIMTDGENPSGRFGSTLLKSFLSINGPNNGDLYGGLLRSELERSEFKEQHIVCTERLIPLYGHNEHEVQNIASWIRNQGFHNFNRNMWILALATQPPVLGPNCLPVTAKTIHDQLYNIFHPLFMATLYPTHPDWKDVAQMLQHTGAISVATGTKTRTKNLSARTIDPSSIKFGSEPSEYYLFYYFWANLTTLNALRRAMDLNLLNFTSSVQEKSPAFDQLVCSYLLCDVVYHARSLQKSWIMQYLYMMCRIGLVFSPLRDNQLGIPYFDHPVVQYFRQGMQVSLSTSAPLHYHHRVDQPLVEEYATLMKLCSLTPQDICEMARNSVLNSNFPMTMKQEWLGANFTALGSFGNEMARSCVCNYRLQFRQESMVHEATLLNLIRSQNAAQAGAPTPPLVHPASVSEALQMPDLVQQFKSSRKLNYIDKRVVYPRISIQDMQTPGTQMFDVVEMLRQVVMLRKKYTNSYASDVKVEDVFNHAHYFKESDFEYNNYYGVFVLSGVGKCPSWPSFIPTVGDFIKDVITVRRAATSQALQRLAGHRLSLLERKFLLHLSMNISNEAGKREEKEWNNRDFFTAHKVDNNIHTDAGLNARTLLEYFVEKAQNHGDDVVFEEHNSPVTLRQLIARYNINVNCITVDELNYQMSSHPDLRSIFLSPNNFMQGRYFAELTKRKLAIDKEDAFSFAENRLRIHGTSPEEWYMLAHWFDRYGMASSQNRWMIAVPRNYRQLRQKGIVKNFGNFIDHLFSALWDISLHPAKDPRFHYFLAHVSGFDCVDEESKIDMLPLDNTFPHDWNTDDNPPYGMYLYYLWANIASLNEFRASRGLGTFTFRPQCGEFGHSDHLIAGFLLANSINHGVTLSKHPVLEYLYYLTQIGVAMSPLSNTAGACAYLENPFPLYFHRGLNVSLATNQPLYFHFTREPLIEEYSIAAKLWKFEFNDLSEIARNSVLQSGFPHSWKEKALGHRFYLNSTLGNDVRNSRVSDIRVAFRFEAYHSELDFLDAQLGTMQRVPRAMRTLEEEQSIVDKEMTCDGSAPDPLLEEYVASLRQGPDRVTSPKQRDITSLVGGSTTGTNTSFGPGGYPGAVPDTGKEADADTNADSEDIQIDGNIDIRTAKEFIVHDINAYEHRIRELTTCMLLLADSNNAMAEEMHQIMENRKCFEEVSGTIIRGNIEGVDLPPSEGTRSGFESVQLAPPGPELWVHGEVVTQTGQNGKPQIK